MKKLLAVILALLLVLGLTACGKGEDVSAGGEFEKPENYASVILVTINPQFRLYLDADGAVLAVEPANDDAKSIAESITVQTGSIDKVIDGIVTAANDGGFVKNKEATVSLSVVEVKDTEVDTEQVLQKAETAVTDSFKKIEVEAEVKVTVEEKDETDAPVSSQPESSTPEDTSSKDESSSEGSSSDTVSSEEHKHSFKAATCTAPKTCSCGETEGKALGHKYTKGVCSRCGAKNPDYRTPLSDKGGKWEGIYIVENEGTKMYYEATIYIEENYIGYGGGGLAIDIMGSEQDVQEAIDNGEAFLFEGEYWVGGFGGGHATIESITENGKTVTIKTDEGSVTFTRTGEKTLKVTACDADLVSSEGIKVGTVFNFK